MFSYSVDALPLVLTAWFGLYYLGMKRAQGQARQKAIEININHQSSVDTYDIHYKNAWNTNSRILSMMHALVLSIYVLWFINHYGLELLELDFYLRQPTALVDLRTALMFMGSYLVVDLICLLANQTEKNSGPTVLHHLLGAFCMYRFYYLEKVQFNAIYYMLTELSTIPLHTGWILIHLKLRDHYGWKWLFRISAFLTMFLFFVLRILGSYYLIYILWQHRMVAFNLLPVDKLFFFLGNGIVIGLNHYWFSRLLRLAAGKEVPLQN